VEDIVPSLLEKIEKDFRAKVDADNEMSRLFTKFADDKGTLHDVSLYARRLGDLLSMTLQENLTEDVLPDGKMYYNIADRILNPMMRQNFNLTMEQATIIQKMIDAKSGIGLEPISADFPESRVKQIIDSLTEDTEFEVIKARMGEPVANCSHSFADDFIKANALYREKAGMRTYLKRTLVGGACPYCVRLAGTFDYNNAPDDIYKRHDSCRCTVTFYSEKVRQNVHTKIQSVLDPQELQNVILETLERS
jgi:hypothetical protein